MAIVLSVRKFFIHRYMLLYSYISHLYEETLLPDFGIGLFQINKDGDRVFVHLEAIHSIFCGVATYEASLAWCDDIVVFEPPIQMFDYYSSVRVLERRSSNLLTVVLFSI